MSDFEKEMEKDPQLKEGIKNMIDSINSGKGSVHMIQYLHDNWCPKSKGTGKCICNPDMKIKDIEKGEINE
jgi:hypothetical protein